MAAVKEMELQGGLKEGQTKETFEKELFGAKEDRAKLISICEEKDGNELASMIESGEFHKKLGIGVSKNAVQDGKVQDGPAAGDNKEPAAGDKNGKNAIEEPKQELKAPGMH
jgi:hypothetical protein